MILVDNRAYNGGGDRIPTCGSGVSGEGETRPADYKYAAIKQLCHASAWIEDARHGLSRRPAKTLRDRPGYRALATDERLAKAI